MENTKITKIKRAPYKNAEKTRRDIINAVISLLRSNKKLDSIAISDIARKAKINRGTFYHHYDNISQVIDDIENELMEKINLLWKKSSEEDNTVKSFLRFVANGVVENGNLYMDLINNVPRYVFKDMREKFFHLMETEFVKIKPMTNEEIYQVNILVSGISVTFIEWLKGNNSNYTLDQLIEYSSALVERVVY